ncbi:hypothetical protein DFH08DRAFT_932361 [Mycena albidolilacea]|uniref:Uncharacterized protein n=1 Tax=Mycena albidolilacea TaxID=1033008 RepID=A0AAD7AGW2_9AGAR|nr:hypothetical protein DFH08DRAFT_932361 [Mycena albidolilacea]
MQPRRRLRPCHLLPCRQLCVQTTSMMPPTTAPPAPAPRARRPATQHKQNTSGISVQTPAAGLAWICSGHTLSGESSTSAYVPGAREEVEGEAVWEVQGGKVPRPASTRVASGMKPQGVKTGQDYSIPLSVGTRYAYCLSNGTLSSLSSTELIGHVFFRSRRTFNVRREDSERSLRGRSIAIEQKTGAKTNSKNNSCIGSRQLNAASNIFGISIECHGRLYSNAGSRTPGARGSTVKILVATARFKTIRARVFDWVHSFDRINLSSTLEGGEDVPELASLLWVDNKVFISTQKSNRLLGRQEEECEKWSEQTGNMTARGRVDRSVIAPGQPWHRQRDIANI